MKPIILFVLLPIVWIACNQPNPVSNNQAVNSNQDSSKDGSRYGTIAGAPFNEGYPSEAGIKALKDELLFQRGTQAYLWALPAINMYGMKDGAEKDFGKGYNILAIWKERMNAKTLITRPIRM